MGHPTTRDLQITTRHRSRHRVRVTVGGDLDLTTIDQLRRSLCSAAPDGTASLALDLSLVTFLDCGGLGTLIGVRHDAGRSGIRLSITEASPAVDRLFTLFDVGEEFGYPGPADRSRPRSRRWLRRRPQKD